MMRVCGTTMPPLFGVPGITRCELALWHEGDHCAYVKELGITRHEWARWVTDVAAVKLEIAPACEAESDDDPVKQQVCYLQQAHPREHSWQLYDPVHRKEQKEAMRMHPNWFRNGIS